jgi:PPOX class probable F420-dependent enzyme
MSILDTSIPSHARAAERLQREIPIWLTTVGRSGQPQSSPVWFWWDGEVFHLISQPGATKITNLRENPLVSLHLQAEEIAEEDIAIFEGVAEFDPVGAEAAWLPAYLEKYRERIDAYGWTPEGMLADYSVPLQVTPTRIRTTT